MFSIVRFALNNPHRGKTDASWIQSWSTIEQSVSVIVACLASFRILAINSRNRPSQDHRPEHGHKVGSSHTAVTAGKKRSPKEKSWFSNLAPLTGSTTLNERPESSMDIELLGSIHRRDPDMEVTSPPRDGNEGGP